MVERQDNKRTKEGTGHAIEDDQAQKIGGEHKFIKSPQFLEERLKYFDELYQQQLKRYEELPKEEIKIVLPDGKHKEGISFKTSPLDVAKQISNSLPEKVMVAQVKYSKRIANLDEGLVDPEAEQEGSEEQWKIWDASRPLEGDCELRLFTFDDNEGRETFWHSSAHVLGQCMEREFGVHLCHGPPTEAGFFYDAYTGIDIFNQEHYKVIEDMAKKIASEKQTFHRLVLTKQEALELFKHNPFKVQLISNKIPEGKKVTAYKNGNLIDLCTGPHIPSTQRIKAFKVMKNSSAYWLGKNTNDSLQRIYGITFPSKKQMDEYIKLIQEAAKRDHRVIGKQQDLFHHHILSPGSTFFYPHGSILYNKLMDFMRGEYKVRGYQEVISPNMFNLKLWKTSGHYKKYKENLFLFKIEHQGFGMKPMNCPGHCVMFDNTVRSYRELPLRFADFGVLHRNEISGALSGLTRVRRFQQDDAHIFCTPEQIEQEILGCLDFLDYVYGVFGFNFELELSTRPAEKLGDDALWDIAEAALEAALNKFGKPWKLNAGDGAFYGPKIDIKVYDALKRPHQCGTVQCDFQLPIRFNLQYKTDQHDNESSKQSESDSQSMRSISKQDSCLTDSSNNTIHSHAWDKLTPEERAKLSSELFPKDELDEEDFLWQEMPVKNGFKRPVIIHRAILGSVERFIGILIEHIAGKWPFWVSPRQVIVLPLSEKFFDYCEKVYLYLRDKGYEVEIDKTSQTLNKKVRNAQLAQFNYILVAGEEEVKTGTVDVRSREEVRLGKMRVNDVHKFFKTQYPEKSKMYQNYYSSIWKPEDYPEHAKEEAKVQ